MNNRNGQSGQQNGPGEQIRPRDDAERPNAERADEENVDLDNLRGGADPTGGQSSEVPRENGKNNPGSEGRHDSGSGDRDTSPLSTPSEGRETARPTEDDLAKRGNDVEDGDE